jgi:hypothetical protein
MIPFNTWVKGLIEACAKTRESNVFTNVNTFQKSPVVQGTIDTSQGPQNGNNGIVSTVTFADNNNATVGSVCATYSNTEAKGIYLKVSQGKLGIEKTDEGKYVTYAPAPDEDGGNNQIVTTGYVNEALSELTQDTGDLKARLTQAEARITALETQLTGLDLSLDSAVTAAGSKPVKGSGIHSFVTGLIDEVNRNLNDAIKDALENNIITSINFAKTKILSKDRKTTFTYTPEEAGIIVIGWHRAGHNLYFKQDGKEMKGNSYDYIGEYVNKGTGVFPVTFALKAGVEYEWKADDGITYVFWTPLTFQVGE